MAAISVRPKYVADTLLSVANVPDGKSRSASPAMIMVCALVDTVCAAAWRPSWMVKTVGRAVKPSSRDQGTYEAADTEIGTAPIDTVCAKKPSVPVVTVTLPGNV